jgi:hypothetical protein
VENKRVGGGRMARRHVLYPGEIDGTQELAWHKLACFASPRF